MRCGPLLLFSLFTIGIPGGVPPGRASEGANPAETLLPTAERVVIGATTLYARALSECLSRAPLERDCRGATLGTECGRAPLAETNAEAVRRRANVSAAAHREIVAAAMLAGLRRWRGASCAAGPTPVPAPAVASHSEESRFAPVPSGEFKAGLPEADPEVANDSAVVEPMLSGLGAVETRPRMAGDERGAVASEASPRSDAFPHARAAGESSGSANLVAGSGRIDALCRHRGEPGNRCGDEARIPETSGFRLPLRGSIVRRFGEREGGRRLRGLILSSDHPQPIVAPADGVVAYAGPFRSVGSLLIIEHRDAYHSLVIGASRLEVQAGDVVTKGQAVGWVAQAPTGSADVYVELRRAGEPVDPMSLLSARDGEVRG